jgi:hypothetical protein
MIRGTTRLIAHSGSPIEADKASMAGNPSFEQHTNPPTRSGNGANRGLAGSAFSGNGPSSTVDPLSKGDQR